MISELAAKTDASCFRQAAELSLFRRRRLKPSCFTVVEPEVWPAQAASHIPSIVPALARGQREKPRLYKSPGNYGGPPPPGPEARRLLPPRSEPPGSGA